MKRQWQIGHMNHSAVSDTFKHSLSTYSNVGVTSRIQSRSKQKPMEKSRDKFYTGYPYLPQKSSLNNHKPPQSTTLKEITHYQYKQNPIRKDIDNVTQRVRELETRLMEYQHKVDTLERTSRHTTKLSTSLEDFMRSQYADIKERERLQERLGTFEQALGHMSTIKADRKDLENIEVGRYYGLTERINELQRQNRKVDNELQEVKQHFEKVAAKIQGNFTSMGEKYEEFIQSNIIKTFDHVNKLTQHYHAQIQELNKSQNIVNDKLQLIQKAAINELSRYQKKNNFATQLLGVGLAGLRVVQSVMIKDERRLKAGLGNFKQNIKQQYRDKPYCTEISSTSTTFSDNIINNMYDSIETLGANTSMEYSFQKVVYKIDGDFNLLDENDHYLINASGQHIRLNQRHIALLKEQGMIF